MGRKALGLLAGLTGAYAALQVVGRRAGSTVAERTAALPGDELVVDPQLVTDHAVDVRAPPEAVWPWLTQMGWHRAGWYTPGWVDRFLFPGNWPSLEALDPTLVRDLQVGDVLPDGPPGTAQFVVAQVRAPYLLVLRSTTHLPPGWDRYGARIDWTWCLHLAPASEREDTRVHLRVRGRMEPWWLRVLYVATIVPADFVMARGMLRGLRQRVEAGRPERVSGRAPVDLASR